MEQQIKRNQLHMETAPPALMHKVMTRLQQREAFIQEQHSVQTLIEGLHDSRWEMRTAAVRALAEYKEEEAYSAIANMLKDEHPQVRAATLHTLNRQKGNVDMLIAGLRDPAWEVQTMAQMLLQEQIPLPMGKQSGIWQERLQHLWSVLISQPRVMHQGTWLASGIVLLIFGILFFSHLFTDAWLNSSVAAAWLTLMIVGASAISATFIYGQEVDPALELVMTTPVSQRLILGCRIMWLSGYNVLLGCLLSALIVLLYGGSFWQIVQLWLGPALLLSSASMALSLIVSSVVVIGMMLALEGLQFLMFLSRESIPFLQTLLMQFWQTSPLIVLLTLCLLLLTVWRMPERRSYVPASE